MNGIPEMVERRELILFCGPALFEKVLVFHSFSHWLQF